MFASRRLLIQLPSLISMYDFITCVMLNLHQSHPSLGVILTFFERKRRKGFAAVVKTYFKINTFFLLFLSSDSMWLGMSGNVILSHDQNNLLKHFCVLLSMFCFILCVIKSCALRCNLVAAEKAQTNTHILAQVLPVVHPQLKSGVEGAVVAHQSDQYRWKSWAGYFGDLRLLLSSRMTVYFFLSFWFFLDFLHLYVVILLCVFLYL